MRSQFGVDAICAHDDIGFGDGAIGERDASRVAVLCEADATVAGVHDLCRQGARKKFDEVGAMHPECGIPARGVRNLDRCDRRSVMAKILRGGSDLGSPFLDRRSQSYALQLPHAVWRDEYAGADLAEGRCLLVNRHSQPVRDQCVRREQTADPASNDCNVQSRIRHALRSRLLRCPR